MMFVQVKYSDLSPKSGIGYRGANCIYMATCYENKQHCSLHIENTMTNYTKKTIKNVLTSSYHKPYS